MTKIYLFIDGSNLYGGQYELFGPYKHLDFGKFIQEIEKYLQIKFDKIYFYASYSPKSNKPTGKEKLYLKNEALFYRSVRETKKVVFFKGYRSKTSGKEKEVDVKLTADLVSFAFLNKYRHVYLLSGDADFLQALFTIKPIIGDIQVICLQNNIMYRAAFFFRTYVLDFGKSTKIRFLKFQKYKFIKLDRKKLVKEIG